MQKENLFPTFKDAINKNPSLLIIFSITLTAVMSVSIITPALPLVMKEFDLTRAKVTLLITVFTFPGIIAAPFYGVLSDRFGRNKLLPPAAACIRNRRCCLWICQGFQRTAHTPLHTRNRWCWTVYIEQCIDRRFICG